MKLIVTVPLPPSANRLTFNKTGGGRANTGDYNAWTEEAGYYVKMAWRRAGQPAFAKPLGLHIDAGCGNQRDIGNLVKPIEDMLVKMIPGLPDDRWNDQVSISRAPDVEGAVITLSSLGPPG